MRDLRFDTDAKAFVIQVEYRIKIENSNYVEHNFERQNKYNRKQKRGFKLT